MFHQRIQRVVALAILGMGLCLAGSTNVLAAGLLTPSDGSPQLDLRDHKVNVLVEDGYAITTVEQRFLNPHGHDMEAIYSFPVPRKAAVHEFAYWIDGKQISGEVVEKEKARQIYEQEKQAGHETALAEKDAYRTFDISVWPVRGGSDVRIRISYIQSAEIETGIGRYLYALEEGGVDEQKLAFWTAQETVTGEFAFDLHLRPDYGVEALRVPAHPSARVWQEADGSWRVQIDNHDAAAGESAPPLEPGIEPTGFQPVLEAPDEEESFTRQFQPVDLNQDIVIYWRQKADEPARVDMVPYKAQAATRGSFMLTLTPGMDLKPITEGRDWIFVLDTSGSMGSKIATLAEGVAEALVRIRPEDRFRIVLFSNSAQELTSGYRAAQEDEIKRAINSLRSLQAGGGTNLYSGLHLGLSMADPDRVGAIVLVTDGVANVGKTQAVDFFQLMQSKDLRLFTAIMGNSANRPLLEPLTRASNGFAKSVSNADDVAGILLQATSKVTHQALHGIQIELNPVAGGETGRDLRIADLRRDQVKTLYRGEQLVLFGHYWGSGEAKLALTGEISGQPVRFETQFSFPETAELNPEIERLWGFAEIERSLEQLALFGPDADMKQSVVDTSLEYGILSPYTSMVVLREERFQALGIKRANRDRLVQEEAALQKRQQQAVVSRRVDQAQPMFSKPRPSQGGSSGDIGLIGLYLAVTLLLIGLSLRRRSSRRGHEQGDT